MPDVILDRRSAPRYPMCLAAEVTEFANRARLSARTSDISRTGCYIDTLNPLAAGSAVLVRLVHGSETFEAPAKVAYLSPGLGMGISFHENLAPSQLAILDRWLMEAAELG